MQQTLERHFWLLQRMMIIFVINFVVSIGIVYILFCTYRHCHRFVLFIYLLRTTRMAFLHHTLFHVIEM